ncbi:MAG: hypothetical protein Q8N18_24140 [Opitutaceae bacterium]|nr:hypothetical protein [Opitutaceae bacterium]
MALVAGVAVTLRPLFDPGVNFYYDWHIHQWLVGWFGEYFRQHGAMPEFLSVSGAVGMPQPVFYGLLLYPSLGTISAVTGAALAIRMGAAAALLMQASAVYLGCRATIGHRGLSVAVALSVTWSIHAMTNLYNRAALPEFFAVVLLSASVGFCTAAIRRKYQSLGLWLGGMCGILAVGSHPPTALVAAGFVLPLAGLGWLALARRGLNRGELATLCAVAAFGLAIMAPWVLANVRHSAELGVVGKYRTLSYSPERVDAPESRFNPLPYDPLIAAGGSMAEGTPYVEAPVHISVGILAIVLLARAWRLRVWQGWAGGFALLGLAWFGLMLTLSMSSAAGRAFGFLAPYVQFGTRFVSQANLGLLVAVLALGALTRTRGGAAPARFAPAALACSLILLALAGAIAKWPHVAAVATPGGEAHFAWGGERSALIAQASSDPAGDYATTRRMLQLAPLTANGAVQVNFPVGAVGGKFGVIGDVTVETPAAGWVITNAVVYPWSKVLINGAPPPREATAANEYRLAVRLPAGRHRLTWAWQPDPVWRVLTAVSRFSLIAMGVIALAWTARALGQAWRQRDELL